MPRGIVLSFEDDDASFYLLGLALSQIAPEIVLLRARDGDEALLLMQVDQQVKPDLIVLNLQLLKRTGFEFLRKMHEDGLANSIAAVVFSSISMEGDRVRCLALGAKQFHARPSSYDGYMSNVKSFCNLLK